MTWSMPSEFPSLAAAEGIGIDLETYDPDLRSTGAGVRRNGYILGVAIATDDGEFQEYYPVAHNNGQNLNKTAVFSWLREELARPSQKKYFFNGQYDLDYLAEVGINVPSRLYCDPMLAEALLDENKFQYGLDSQAQQYLFRKKSVQLLEDAAKKMNLKGDVYRHLRDLPVSIVGKYAIQDIVDTIDIFKKQALLLRQEDVWNVYLLEQGLIPLLLHMKRTGVRIDMGRLPQVIEGMQTELDAKQTALNAMAGRVVNVNAAASIAPAFKHYGLEYPLTPKTHKPSFTKKFLEKHPHELARTIMEVRQLDKLIGTFLKGAIEKHLVRGRIHCQFNQVKSDAGGTGTGRFSSSSPNLQQVPTRSAAGKLIRKLFIPEEGHTWIKADYGQIEVRMLAQFALGPGAQAFRDHYVAHPETDYHTWTAKLAGIERQAAKTINFAILYGQGVRSTAAALGITIDEANEFLRLYHGALPFAKYTLNKASDIAASRGFVRTILGRRRRYPFWGAADRKLGELIKPSRNQKDVRQAIAALSAAGSLPPDVQIGVQRYKTYTALNSVLQGSAGDLMKAAMLQAWEEGIFDVLVLHLTVHDELDVSKPPTKEGDEALKRLVEIMVSAIKFSVPILVDPEEGPNWGELA